MTGCYFGHIHPLDRWVLQHQARQVESCTWTLHDSSFGNASEMEIPSFWKDKWNWDFYHSWEDDPSTQTWLAPTLLHVSTFVLSFEILASPLNKRDECRDQWPVFAHWPPPSGGLTSFHFTTCLDSKYRVYSVCLPGRRVPFRLALQF